jgi:CRISPR-associated protein Cmr3
MATGKPKRTQRLVPPGAVYFFERVDRKPFTPDQAQALWCTALGHREHTSQGFGRVVPGIWQPKDQPTC